MNYDRNSIKSLIASFIGHENIIAIPRVLVDVTGDWGLAAMLNQLMYWSERSKRKDGLVYKSSVDWYNELLVSDYTVRKFKALPYVETKLLKANGAPTIHYRINWDVLIDEINKSICRIEQMDLLKSTNGLVEIDESLTETTTEITTSKELTDSYESVSVPNNSNSTVKKTRPTPIKAEIKTTKKPVKEKENVPPSEHQPMMMALSHTTGMDYKIKTNAARLGKAAKELVAAGYHPSALKLFEEHWKNDWRYKADKKPPTIGIILSDIGKINTVPEVNIREQKLQAALEELRLVDEYDRKEKERLEHEKQKEL